VTARMEQIKAHYRCKNCMWAHFMPQDMNMRTCRGAPPQVALAPVKGPNGQVGMSTQQFWPSVPLDHPICGAFRRSQTTIDAENTPLDKLLASVPISEPVI
jgi:hypothetical protein